MVPRNNSVIAINSVIASAIIASVWDGVIDSVLDRTNYSQRY